MPRICTNEHEKCYLFGVARLFRQDGAGNAVEARSQFIQSENSLRYNSLSIKKSVCKGDINEEIIFP